MMCEIIADTLREWIILVNYENSSHYADLMGNCFPRLFLWHQLIYCLVDMGLSLIAIKEKIFKMIFIAELRKSLVLKMKWEKFSISEIFKSDFYEQSFYFHPAPISLMSSWGFRVSLFDKVISENYLKNSFMSIQRQLSQTSVLWPIFWKITIIIKTNETAARSLLG